MFRLRQVTFSKRNFVSPLHFRLRREREREKKEKRKNQLIHFHLDAEATKYEKLCIAFRVK